VIQRQIDVALGERSYPIYFGTAMTESFAPTCRQHGIPRHVVIITDTNVAAQYLEPLEKHLRQFEFDASSIVVPPGETQKSLSRANAIFTALLQRRVGRKAAIIALGGGVVGDLAGFVAATYQRGIALIQVPTTLLAQVDSSVGGKVAVNHPLGKNMIGAFYQPKFVWIDGATLQTLPPREIVCGLAEVVKYGVIFDAEFFAYLEANLEAIMRLDQEAIMHIQARCCELKARVVAEDERELGLRAVLNYGHTVGHALEAVGKYRALKHGEAVLLGMAAEAFIAREMGLLPANVLERIETFVSRIPLRLKKDAFAPAKILDTIRLDKKAVEGKTRFVLPVQLGEVRVLDEVEPELIRSSLKRAFEIMGTRRSPSH
jgi:3-dehydroquinate synthase